MVLLARVFSFESMWNADCRFEAEIEVHRPPVPLIFLRVAWVHSTHGVALQQRLFLRIDSVRLSLKYCFNPPL